MAILELEINTPDIMGNDCKKRKRILEIRFIFALFLSKKTPVYVKNLIIVFRGLKKF